MENGRVVQYSPHAGMQAGRPCQGVQGVQGVQDVQDVQALRGGSARACKGRTGGGKRKGRGGRGGKGAISRHLRGKITRASLLQGKRQEPDKDRWSFFFFLGGARRQGWKKVFEKKMIKGEKRIRDKNKGGGGEVYKIKKT